MTATQYWNAEQNMTDSSEGIAIGNYSLVPIRTVSVVMVLAKAQQKFNYISARRDGRYWVICRCGEQILFDVLFSCSGATGQQRMGQTSSIKVKTHQAQGSVLSLVPGEFNEREKS